MSTILDALKRVEEQIRNEAEQRAAAGPPGGSDPSKVRNDAPVQAKAAVSGENDDVMEVYTRIVGMLARIQDQVRTAADEGRAEAKRANAELAKSLTALQNDFARQTEAIRKEFQRRDAERDAGNAALAAVQSQTDVLKKALAESKGSTGELAQSMAAVKKELTREMESLHKDLRERDRERDAGNAALAATQLQTDGLRKMLAQANGAYEKLAQAVSVTQNDLARLTGAIKKEFQKRDSERDAENATLAAVQSQTDALRKNQAETRAAFADLAQVVTTLQNDLSLQKELIQKGSQKQDADREATKSRLAESQSQIDAVKKILAGTGEANAELTQAVIALQDDFMRQREAIRAEFLKLTAEREAVNARLAVSQSEDDALKRLLAGAGASHAELAQAMTALQNDFARQAEATQAEFQKLIAEHEAANARLAASQSENGALKKLLAGTGVSNAELAQAMTALQNDLARQAGAIQAEFQKRDAAREALDAKLAESESQTDALKAILTGVKESHAGLAQTLITLQNEFAGQAEMIQAEFQKRDAEGEAGKAALAAMQSQTDTLKQLLVDRERAVTEALGGGFFTADTGATAAVRHEPFHAAVGESKPSARVDKDEAVRLHSSARDAYARGDLSEALHLLNIIDAAFPRNKSVLYNRAQCLIGLGRNDEARKLCDYLGTTLNYSPAEDLKRQIRA